MDCITVSVKITDFSESNTNVIDISLLCMYPHVKKF